MNVPRPLLIFDGDCGFCKLWIRYWQVLTGESVDYAPYQERAVEFPDIPIAEFKRAVHLVLPNGETRKGAHAVFTTLTKVPGQRWWLWCYERLPAFSRLCEWGYGLIARQRPLAYRVSTFLWGKQPLPPSYRLITALFQRALGLIYFIAFLSFALQIPGLIGAQGILPAEEYLNRAAQSAGPIAYWYVPTLFWLHSGDGALQIVGYGGALLGLAAVMGISYRWLFLLLYVSYLSLVSVGQNFMSFQWDALLLETGLLVIFLTPTRMMNWLFRLLLFKLMFLSGAVKLLSQDPAWLNLTALTFHYETQPLPNTISWYAHQLPAWLQVSSCAVMFGIELLVPLLFFAPRRLRYFAAVATLVLQALIFLSGNYNFFNLLAAALCLFLLDDERLVKAVPARWRNRVQATHSSRMRSFAASLGIAFSVLVLLSLHTLQMLRSFRYELPTSAIAVLRALSPLHAVNGYGLFSVMTTARPEIIVEGSNDGVSWEAYEFKYKPGALERRPAWAAPHQPRLDWQMWFAALSDYRNNPWFVNFCARLLENSPAVLGLLAHNPFSEQPPRYIRAVLYRYHFTTLSESARTGRWWHRERLGLYLPAISINRQ